MSLRKTAVLVGVLFLTATVTFIIAEALITDVLDRPDYLSGAAGDANTLAAGALLAFVDGLAVVGIAVLMFPLLKRHSEPLALGYVSIRGAELAAILVYLTAPLLAITLGDGLLEGTNGVSGSQHLGSLLLAQHDVALVMIYLSTGVSGLILAYLLFRSQLVPRAIAILGVVGYPVLVAGTVLGMFGIGDITEGAGVLAVVLGGLFELILPVWLFAKGFSSPDTA